MGKLRCSLIGQPQSHGMCLKSLQNHSCIMRAGSIEVQRSRATAIICNLFRIIPESHFHHAGRQPCFTKRYKRRGSAEGYKRAETMSNNDVPLYRSCCPQPIPSCIMAPQYDMLCCSPCAASSPCNASQWGGQRPDSCCVHLMGEGVTKG